MATVKSPKTIGEREQVGDALLAVAATTDVSAVSKRLVQFEKAHAAFRKATEMTRAAEAKLRAAEAAVGEMDVDQDAAVEALAAALVGAGGKRGQPFAAYGGEAPSQLRQRGYAVEAKAIHALVRAVKKTKPSASVSSAADAADAAASAVEAGLAAIPPLEKAWRETFAGRNALALAWEQAFSALKRATRTADDDHATQLFAMLFQTIAPSSSGKTKAKQKRAT